ncbi:MAG: helix-turn-helix domain-containing protein [Carbonactinosporaceae bacterium]
MRQAVKTAASPSETAARRFYSVAEAARMFGMSEMTLYRAIHAGEFPAIRIRGRLIIPAKAIDAMADAALSGQLVDAADWTESGGAA